MSERELQDAIVDCARLLGWLVAHFRPAETGKGWRTPMQGDAGFPDLVLARRGRVIFAELKAKGKQPKPHQRAWLDALAPEEPGGLEVYVLWPEDWLSGHVEALLR